MRTLVMSGGGSHGAFQAGALKYIVGILGVQYDSICGVSVGALNASFMSMFPKEQEQQGVENLVKIWENISTSSVYKQWLPFGPVHALWLDSLFNSQPLINLVRSTLNLDTIRKNNRNIAVGATSLTTGNYKSFTQNDDCFIDAVLASSSYPMGLKPIEIDGEKWTDGGVKHILPIKEAIDFGSIDIDVIICAPPQTTTTFNDIDTATLGMRCLDLMGDQMIASDLKIADLYNQLVEANARPDKKLLNINVVRPEVDISYTSLSFNHSDIMTVMDLGYQLAKKQYRQ